MCLDLINKDHRGTKSAIICKWCRHLSSHEPSVRRVSEHLLGVTFPPRYCECQIFQKVFVVGCCHDTEPGLPPAAHSSPSDEWPLASGSLSDPLLTFVPRAPSVSCCEDGGRLNPDLLSFRGLFCDNVTG